MAQIMIFLWKPWRTLKQCQCHGERPKERYELQTILEQEVTQLMLIKTLVSLEREVSKIKYQFCHIMRDMKQFFCKGWRAVLASACCVCGSLSLKTKNWFLWFLLKRESFLSFFICLCCWTALFSCILRWWRERLRFAKAAVAKPNMDVPVCTL